MCSWRGSKNKPEPMSETVMAETLSTSAETKLILQRNSVNTKQFKYKENHTWAYHCQNSKAKR